MGWQTNVNVPIHFNKETYNSIYEVESKIEDNERFLKEEKDKLLIYAASSPKDLIQKDCEGSEFTLAESILMLVNKALENYEEYSYELYKLDLLKEYWERRSGDFVTPNAYYKYIGTSDLIFIPDRIYEVFHGRIIDEEYYFINNWEYSIPIKKEKFHKFFTKSSKEEYNEYWRNHFE